MSDEKPDMYAEPGHDTLRRLVKEEPEWAVSRLAWEYAARLRAEAEVERLRRLFGMKPREEPK